MVVGGRRGAAADAGASRGATAAAVVERGALGGLPLAAAAAKEPERVITVDDCSKGRFLGVRIPPDAAAPLLLLLLVGVEAFGSGVVIAPRPRAGVAASINAVVVIADFCLGVASLPPDSSAERRVVRPDAAAAPFSALGSTAETTDAAKII